MFFQKQNYYSLQVIKREEIYKEGTNFYLYRILWNIKKQKKEKYNSHFKGQNDILLKYIFSS